MDDVKWCYEYLNGHKQFDMSLFEPYIDLGTILIIAVFALFIVLVGALVFGVVFRSLGKRVRGKTARALLLAFAIVFFGLCLVKYVTDVRTEWHYRTSDIEENYDEKIPLGVLTMSMIIGRENRPRPTYRSVCERGKLAQRLLAEAGDYETALAIIEETWKVKSPELYFETPPGFEKWVNASQFESGYLKGCDRKNIADCGAPVTVRFEKEHIFRAITQGILARAITESSPAIPEPLEAANHLNRWTANSFYYGNYNYRDFDEPFEGLDETENITHYFTSSAGALASARGICTDYSLVLVSLLKTIGIPARVVSVVFEQRGHVVVEVYADGRWHLFDPTASFVGPVGTIENYIKDGESLFGKFQFIQRAEI